MNTTGKSVAVLTIMLALSLTLSTKPVSASTISGSEVGAAELAAAHTSLAQSNSIIYSSNTALTSDVFCSDITIDPGVTLTTNGFNVYCSGTFNNQGTVVTGYTPPQNFPNSYGGSGGGGLSQLCNAGTGAGFSTLAPGGLGNSVNHSGGGGAGSTPPLPTLSKSVIQGWYQSGMFNFLAGAGGETVCSGAISGGAGAHGLYLQASLIIAGTINSKGQAGSGACSGQGLSGGGGGGALLVSYGSGGYTSGTYGVTGGAGAISCDGTDHSGAGGNGQVLTFNYGTNPPIVAQGPWRQLFPTSSPSPRSGHAMAYDAADGYVVLFGGDANPGSFSRPVSDTWIFKGGQWTQLFPSTSPSPRDELEQGMVYDAADGYVLLFGGFNNAALLGDTWMFKAGQWTQLSPAASPSPRSAFGMTYDAADGYVVLFGGQVQVGSIPDAQTWMFKGGQWTQLNPATSPSTRLNGYLAYDAADSYVVMFGGPDNQTWKFIMGSWTLLSPALAPTTRGNFGFGFDSFHGFVLLFGGGSAAGFQSDTWAFKGGSWMNLTKSENLSVSPSARSTSDLVSDIADGYVVLFGGSGGPAPYLGDTWAFAPLRNPTTTWTNLMPAISPPARWGAGMTYDTVDGYVVLFAGDGAGGLNLDDTWTYKNGVWTQLFPTVSPSTRGGDTAMAYDPVDGYVLLFGGISSTGQVLGDTWSFKGGTWTNLTSSISISPPPRQGASLAYDPVDNYTLLFGGSGIIPPNADLNDAWAYKAGTWSKITTVNAPSIRALAELVYDPSDNGMILFGGIGPTGALADTWKFAGGAWTQLLPSSSPPPRWAPGMVWDSADGFLLMFGGWNNTSDGLPCCPVRGDTWEYSAGSWTQLLPSNSPSPRGGPNMAYDAGDAYPVLFGGQPAGCCTTSDTWKFSSMGTPPAFDYSLSNNGPVSIAVGSSGTVTITATLKAGTAQPVTLSCVTPLPTGVSCSYASATVTPTRSGATNVLMISASASTPVGSLTVMVTGSPRGATTTATSVAVTVTAVPDFVISANPTSLTLGPEDSEVCQGQPASSTCDDEGHVTITVTALFGFTDPVNLSVSSVPHLSAELTMTLIDTTGTSTLRISEASSGPGSYVVTVTGTSGSLSHQATINITVRPPEKLKCGGEDRDCKIESDAPLSNANFSGHSIHFTMTGEKGTTGAANVTIARSAVPDINKIRVLIDHNELSKSDVTITSDNSNYHVYFQVTFHSNVDVEIDLSPASTIFGFDPTIFYGMVGGVITLIAVVGAAVGVRRRKQHALLSPRE